MQIKTNKDRGRIGLTMAINYFSCQGYTVSLPLNDTQWYDLIIEKEGVLELVQCKCTGTENGEISLRSTGGTNGGVYDNILNHPQLSYIFCVDKDMNMFCIPFSALKSSGNTNTIRLRTEPTKNNQGFQTYCFQVNF